MISTLQAEGKSIERVNPLLSAVAVWHLISVSYCVPKVVHQVNQSFIIPVSHEVIVCRAYTAGISLCVVCRGPVTVCLGGNREEELFSFRLLHTVSEAIHTVCHKMPPALCA